MPGFIHDPKTSEYSHLIKDFNKKTTQLHLVNQVNNKKDTMCRNTQNENAWANFNNERTIKEQKDGEKQVRKNNITKK